MRLIMSNLNNSLLIYIRFTFLAILRRDDSQEDLQSDSIAVSSNGDGELEPYKEDEEVPEEVKEKGNSAQGDDGGK
jgi:hypothetical protein